MFGEKQVSGRARRETDPRIRPRVFQQPGFGESPDEGSFKRLGRLVLGYTALNKPTKKVDCLCQELEKRGLKCWHDQKVESITKDSMAAGIRTSVHVILFLSEGVLQRPFVQPVRKFCWNCSEA